MFPNMTAKYVLPDGQEAAAGEPGELWLQGPNIFKGYLNKPDATKNAMSEDGYFKTGDVGFQDKNHNFYITDRVKELIKYKGFQVPPAELEGLLMGHQGVNDVAVIGVQNEAEHTEVPRAYVVPDEKSKRDAAAADEIIKWMDARVANHKRLRGGIRFIDEIPKTSSGKILRKDLKEKAKEEEKRGNAGLKAKL